jgi:hypothetical protein
VSVVELQELEEVKGLVTRGRQVGVLTYGEIATATATAELGLDETDVDELYGLFERAEIELVEEIDPAIAESPSVSVSATSAPAARLRWISSRRGLPTRWRCSSRTSAGRGC